jgi:hypothetical protein
MTFRVQRASRDDGVVLTLSGDMAGAHAAELQALLGAERDQPLVLDLAEACVIDRAGVLLLARAEADGATLTNCPAYVREWIERERETSERIRTDAGAEEHSMTQMAKTADERTFQSANGLRIFSRAWHPQEHPHAIVAIVPGFNSHSGYYDWVAEQLTARPGGVRR